MLVIKFLEIRKNSFIEENCWKERNVKFKFCRNGMVNVN